MWLFLPKGFVSVVADLDNPDHLLVRGRFRGDIKRLFPGADVRGTPDYDYPFRASIPRAVVQARVAAEIGKISYPNFKNAVPKKRAAIYHRIWALLATAARPRAGRAAFEARLTYSRPGELRVDLSNATGPSWDETEEAAPDRFVHEHPDQIDIVDENGKRTRLDKHMAEKKRAAATDAATGKDQPSRPEGPDKPRC